MRISANKVEELLFRIAASLFSEKEYRKVMSFLDNMTIAEDKKNKADCETELKELLKEIALFPDTKAVGDLNAAIMSKPFIVRAYFICWLGEASEDLKKMKTIDLPTDPSLQNIVGYLLQSMHPFWRVSISVEETTEQ